MIGLLYIIFYLRVVLTFCAMIENYESFTWGELTRLSELTRLAYILHAVTRVNVPTVPCVEDKVKIIRGQYSDSSMLRKVTNVK